MISQCDVAIDAFDRLATRATQNELRKTAAVEQNYRLFALR